MGMVKVTARRSHVSMLGQLAVSITATVAATLIVTALQHEVTVFRPSTHPAELTSGGKFAARLEALRASADDLAPTGPPPLPLLVADAVLHDMPVPLTLWMGNEPSNPAGEPPRATKRAARVEQNRRQLVEANLGVMPPRRSDSILSEGARTNPATEGDSTVGSIWLTTKGLSKQALSLGSTVLGLVNPVNLLP